MKLLSEDHKKKLALMLARAFPSWSFEFKHTYENIKEKHAGMNYVMVKSEVGTFDITVDKLLLLHLIPELHKLLAVQDNVSEDKWKERYVTSVTEFFGNVVYDIEPKTLIDFTYDTIFDELRAVKTISTATTISEVTS